MTTVDSRPGRDKAVKAKPPRRYCGAKKRQTPGTCARPAGWGTDHPGAGRCKLHGGSTASGRAAAQRELASDALVTFGIPVERDPVAALLEELYRTVGAVEWLGAQVAGLHRGEVGWGVTRSKFGGDDDGGVVEEAKINIWVVMWQAERKHLVAVSRACIDAGIEERRVALAEAQGRALAEVTRAILEAMFVALVTALGEYAAARVVLEAVWPRLVGEIVPVQLRSAITQTGEVVA